MARAGIMFQEKDEWYTPKFIIDFFGPFDYDPATTDERAKLFGIENYDTIETDGLKSDWSKYDKIWINPPFTKKFEFLQKAIKSKKHIFIALPIDTLSTMKFQDIIPKDCGYAVWVPNKRIQFEDENGVGKRPAFSTIILELRGKRRTVKHWSVDGS